MPLPPITDSQLDTDSPCDQALFKDGLRDRDNWNRSAATTGSGIAPHIAAFEAAFIAHTHDGTPGQAAKISAAGIASNAVNQADMIGTGEVKQDDIAPTTMTSGNFANFSVTGAKLSGTLGVHVTGSQAFNEINPPGTNDELFEGDTAVIGNASGKMSIVCNPATKFFFVRSMTPSEIRLGARVATITGASWSWDFWLF